MKELAERLRKHRDDLVGAHGTNASILRVDLAHAALAIERLYRVSSYCHKCEMTVPEEAKLAHLAEHVLDSLTVIGGKLDVIARL